MLRPQLRPRIEERDNFAAFRIDPRQIRPFAEIAARAAIRQIFGVIGPAVLFGDNMIDVKPGEGQRRLRQAAILAAIARPLPDQ